MYYINEAFKFQLIVRNFICVCSYNIIIIKRSLFVIFVNILSEKRFRTEIAVVGHFPN